MFHSFSPNHGYNHACCAQQTEVKTLCLAYTIGCSIYLKNVSCEQTGRWSKIGCEIFSLKLASFLFVTQISGLTIRCTHLKPHNSQICHKQRNLCPSWRRSNLRMQTLAYGFDLEHSNKEAPRH